MTIPPGTQFGHYEIRSAIGKDDTGEVYLARDTHLDRSVALTILDGNFDGSQDQIERSVQEAQTATTISHLNIANFYEIGQARGTHYITTEFVDGITLRQHMQSGPLKPLDAVYIAVQTASALAAAHQAGVVHRHLRPEYIMVGRDGVVKVRDFGLVKLTRRKASRAEAGTRFQTGGEPNLEAARYMAPEQTYPGLDVDARADIWSLGVVLYEMLVGHLPFDGPTTPAVISSIQNDEPPPLSHFLSQVTTELQQIVRKTLCKNRDERYKTARDLQFDLKRLWQRLEVKDVVERLAPPAEGLARIHTTGGGPPTPATSHDIDTSLAPSAHHESSAEYLFGEFRRHKAGGLIAVAIILAAVAAIGFGVYRLSHSRSGGNANGPFWSIKVNKLTTTGTVTAAAISPDGKYVVHAVATSGRQSLLVRQIATTVFSQIVPPAEVEYQGITFSTDGNYIYYVRRNNDNPIRELYQVSVLGGAPRRLIVDIDSAVTFSPDGKRIAFVRRYSSVGEDALIVANADGGEERKLLIRKQPDFLSTGGPAWAPEGDLIAFSSGTVNSSGTYMTVAGVQAGSGKESSISNQRWFRVGRLAWVENGGGLMVNAVDQTLGLYQIWHLSFPDGEARKITNDASDYRGLSIAADSGPIVTVQSDQLSSISMAEPDKNASQSRQITSGKYDGFYGLSFSRDGKIFYATNASGKQDIWSMEQDGSGQQQLTVNAGVNVWPSVSPDGRFVAFTSDRTGILHIWRMNRDGGNPRQLTNGNGEDWSHFSPDGQWVIYTAVGGANRFTLWKVPVEGGEPVQLADKISMQSVISPDGKLIACGYRGQQNAPWKLAVISLEGQETKYFDLAPSVPLPIVVRWMSDSREVTYIDTNGGVSNIWKQSINGGPPRKLTDFASDQIFAFDWSPTGKQFAYSRGVAINDVVMITDSNR